MLWNINTFNLVDVVVSIFVRKDKSWVKKATMKDDIGWINITNLHTVSLNVSIVQSQLWN